MECCFMVYIACFLQHAAMDPRLCWSMYCDSVAPFQKLFTLVSAEHVATIFFSIGFWLSLLWRLGFQVNSAAALWHLLKQYTCLVLFIGPSPRKRGLVHTVSTCVTLVIFNVMFVITNPQETLYIMCISRQWVPGFSWGELVKVTWY